MRSRQSAARQMPLRAHLRELRRRVQWSAVALLVGTVAGWFLSEFVWSAVTRPLAEITSHTVMMNFATVSSAFDTRMRIAFGIGIILAAPVIITLLLGFLLPGMTQKERRHVLGFTLASGPLFIAGIAAGWLVFPHIVTIMASFVPEFATSFYDARMYLDFALKLMLIMGVAFELPVVLVVLNFAGVLSARSILVAWRWAILVITIFTACATPAADVISMVFLALPLIALYFAAVGVAALHDRRVARSLEDASARTLPRRRALALSRSAS